MRYGSLSVDTSYQPSEAPASAAARAASVMTPSTSVTSAPYNSALADERRLDVAREKHLRGQSRPCGVGRHRIAGIAG